MLIEGLKFDLRLYFLIAAKKVVHVVHWRHIWREGATRAICTDAIDADLCEERRKLWLKLMGPELKLRKRGFEEV
eukprot:Skav210246  [mRNA]  locus=scaffold1929:111970:113089:+ [translate_table: standard]